MQISYASVPTPGRVNEDYVVSGPEWVIVLDGATHHRVWKVDAFMTCRGWS